MRKTYDKTELKVLMVALVNHINLLFHAGNREELTNKIYDMLIDYEKVILENLYGCYAMCFSELMDDLGMWRAFGDNQKGFCVGFQLPFTPLDKSNEFGYITLTEKTTNKSLELKKIQYYLEDRLKKEAEKIYEKLKSEPIPDTKNFSEKILGILYQSPAIKTNVYNCEKEWRIVKNIDRTINFKKHKPLKYINRNDDIVGHLEEPFDKSLITQVILGSKCKNCLQEIKDFLFMNGFNVSEINFSISKNDKILCDE